MDKDYFISIALDARRKLKNGKYPVRLRVFTTNPRKQKLYPTIFEFTPKEFDSVWNTTKPRKEWKENRLQLQEIEKKANDEAKKLSPFTFEGFEKVMYRKPGEGISIKYQYEQVIQELRKRKQVGTSSTYELSEKSIIEFVEKVKKGKYQKSTLYDITPGWLKDYEQYSIDTKGRSLTTVSIYLRTLRTIYNKAIAESEIEKEFYPFGKRKYQVPATQNVKKALNRDQLKTLFQSTPQSPEQVKAKDFWFFSYACNGINIKDIALLRYKDIQNGKIEFIRAKTRNTTKGNQKPITTFLNDFSTEIIERYGNKNKHPETLVFDILVDGLSPEQEQMKIKNFTRYVNQHLKKLCRAIGLPEEISSYWARHSFASNSIKKGATMEFIQESLGHGNLKTTQTYFSGFDSDTKKEFANTIMDFD